MMALEKRPFIGAGRKVLRYRLLKPVDYDPKKSYPLVLFLHGAGERGSDNEKQLVHGVSAFVKQRKNYPCFLAAPQCPKNIRWVEVDWSADSHRQPAKMSAPMKLAFELIATLVKEFAIDPKRIYITGLSMGGFGAWDMLARRPDLFAAAVLVCGGADEATAAKIAKIPQWAFHGAKDEAVMPSRSRNMIDALKKAGGKPKYTEYPRVGHDAWNPAYKDREMFRWLFAQKKA
jgi:predicted peptidase